MTSKTFKSPLPDSNYKFEIGKNVGAEHLFAWISGCGVDSISMALAPSDAPALALAILEAAGVEATPMATSVAFGTVVADLQRLITEQERATAEARERTELEAEALGLYLACFPNHAVHSFAQLRGKTGDQWLAVARRAREIAKEATK